MRAKVRAVIWHDGRLVAVREWRQGRPRVSLPGGRMKDRECVEDALVREVLEETGLHIRPSRLLYVAEVVGPFEPHEVNLVFLAEQPTELQADRDGVELIDPAKPLGVCGLAAAAA